MADEEVRITSSTGGEKGTKAARFDLIPYEAIWQLAELYGRGALKYADRNWELGYDWSLSFAAAQRHLWKFWNGEDNDPETGVPHPVAAMFHCAALTTYLQTHPEFDDRPGKSEHIHHFYTESTISEPVRTYCIDCGFSEDKEVGGR